MSTIRRKWIFFLQLLLLISFGLVQAQDSSGGVSFIPCGDLFDPLSADPKQPRFSASYQWSATTDRRLDVGSVSFGENFGLLRWKRPTSSNAWQLNLYGAVFSQFDMQAPLTDLINSDFDVGLSVNYRRGQSSARAMVYHQSSHLGDEYLEHNHPNWVNLNFESAELLGSREMRAWRFYGGGEYLFHRKPSGIGRGLVHSGMEWRPPTLLKGLFGPAGGHLMAALDVKAWQETGWSAAVSLKTGIEFTAPNNSGCRIPYRSFLVEFYHGFNPYGQFYSEKVSYLALGVEMGL